MTAILSQGPASLHVFRQRSFRFFMASLSVWSLGRWMESLAVGWLVLQLTNSPFLLGVATAARVGPHLLAPLGGTVADRMDRGRLLGLAQAAQAAISLVIGVLAVTDRIQVWQVLVLSGLAGTANAFAQPTRQTLVFDLAGRHNLVVGNALMRAAIRASFMVGSPLAGFIVARWGIAPCLFLVAGLDLGGAALSFMIRAGNRTAASHANSFGANLSEAVRFVRGQPAILALLSLEITYDTFVVPYHTLMPVFARDVLEVGPTGLGLLLGASGAGSLLGALGMATIRSHARKGALLLSSYVVLGGALLLFSLSPWYYFSLLVLLGVGILDSVAMTLLPALIQTASPEDMRGRVMGLYVFTWAAVPVGSLQAGAVASLLGAPFAVGLNGVLVALLVAGIARRALRVRAWD